MKAHLRIFLIPIGAAKLAMEVRVSARKTMAKSRTNEKVNIAKLVWKMDVNELTEVVYKTKYYMSRFGAAKEV
jgi:hypothetical protein